MRIVCKQIPLILNREGKVGINEPKMRTIVFGLCCILPALFGQVYAGDFVGKVTVKYNVFTVLEGDRFYMSCEATHEDRRPDLQWYFVDIDGKATNLTRLLSGGTGNTAQNTYSRAATERDSGDYYCSAYVGLNADQKKTSPGIPIQVIKKDREPRVLITKERVKGQTVLTCKVDPWGSGYLTWRHEGKLIKHDKNLVPKLELVAPSDGEYQCYGNLTLGGFKYFLSHAYATAATGWSYTASQTSFLTSILVCFVALLNL